MGINKLISKVRMSIILTFCLFTVVSSWGQSTTLPDSSTTNKNSSKSPLIHKISIEFRTDHIIPTNPFLKGQNNAGKAISTSLSAHLRYSFQAYPNTPADRVFGGVYQGIGFAKFKFGNEQELGDPQAIYLFQGARIARITPRLSFNYEWNFGVSWGWQPYDEVYNQFNAMMGSKINAYINADFFLHWMLSRRIDLQTGVTLTHFSNGNTEIPNAGMNTVGCKMGLAYNFGKKRERPVISHRRTYDPVFLRHISYDLTLFGSWCRQGVELNDLELASPHAYPVAGFNFSPMYNFGYKFRAGLSLDGIYDGSANVYTEDVIVSSGGGSPYYSFYNPGINKQLALGLSARGEFVMPYFTIGVGLGVNVLHGGGDLKAFYQVFALKIAVTRSSFIHIGYCLKDFHVPNYLMLGVGYRFNNKSRIK